VIHQAGRVPGHRGALVAAVEADDEYVPAGQAGRPRRSGSTAGAVGAGGRDGRPVQVPGKG